MPEKNLIQKEDIFKLSGTVPRGRALLRSVMWSKGTKSSAYIIYMSNACVKIAIQKLILFWWL